MAFRHPFLALLQQPVSDSRQGPRDIAAALGVAFADMALLDEALTHRSAGDGGRRNNQRLEFLGDRVLGLIVAERLMRDFADESEGALAPRLAALVSAASLTEVARSLDIGHHLTMAPGEESNGGRANAGNLADACEALIGALYLDGGQEAARDFVERHWRPLIAAQPEPPKDAKTALQEWSQARKLGLPQYRLVASTGPDHRPTFRIAVTIAGHGGEEGEASGKRAAERAAAERMLARLHGDG